MRVRNLVQSSAAVSEMEERRRRRLEQLPRTPRVPLGSEVGAPNYVGVGVQKAGTTWWNRLISEHPQNNSLFKELRFFQVGWNAAFTSRNVEHYHQYFPRTRGQISGEWTPNYVAQPWALKRLKIAAPDAILILLLRDPLARLRSGLRHFAFRFPAPLESAFVSYNIEMSLYSQQLSNVLIHFPREQILVLQFEKCLSSIESELARTYRCLGVDPNFVPSNIREPINEGQGPLVPLSADFEESVGDLYRADAEALSKQWPEIDLDLWPSIGSKPTS